MKVRIKRQPTGLINGDPWPGAGEVIDLPEHVAAGMLANDQAEAVKVEKRPAPTAGVETRKAKKKA